MNAANAFTRSRWTRFERILIVVMLLVFSLGAPGLGVETREAATAPILALAYSLAFLAPIAAVVASWRWMRAATWLALIGGALVLALVLLDLAGVIAGPPPIAMIAVDVAVAALALVLLWRNWVLARR